MYQSKTNKNKTLMNTQTYFSTAYLNENAATTQRTQVEINKQKATRLSTAELDAAYIAKLKRELSGAFTK